MRCQTYTQTVTVTGTLTDSREEITSSISEVPKVNTVSDKCPTNKITHIGKVGNSLVVTLDDCTFYKTSLDKLDLLSFGKATEVVTDVVKRDAVIVVIKTNLLTGETKEYELI